MRALRVVGLSEDGKSVICEDPARTERFTIPADERLRAAARGDVTRLGQIEIELESQMRPREIQARIRAGESVEQIAAAAGVPAHRIERYAYPVLLERSRTAELAQRAHPIREEGPDVQTLAEVAAHAFGLRGQDYATANWDSWRGEDGKWVVQLHWLTGRSDNKAHWAFHPGAQGGTVTPLDDNAHDLLDPAAANRPLRTVRPVTELARQALEVQAGREPAAPAPEVDTRPEPVATRPDPEPEILAAEDIAPRSAPARAAAPTRPAAPRQQAQPAAGAPKPLERRPVERRATGRPSIPPLTMPPMPGAPVEEPAAERVEHTREPEPVEVEPAAQAEEPSSEEAPARKAEPPAAKRGKKNHPIVPSWEDVLLGVRTQRG